MTRTGPPEIKDRANSHARRRGVRVLQSTGILTDPTPREVLVPCLFCRIVSGEVSSKKVHEDDSIVAFEDINPQAPVHVLVIPKQHVSTLNDLTPEHDGLVGRLHRVAAQIARERGIAADGYRVVMNCNAGAGQTVFHIHLHLLGGRSMTWPPG